MPDRGILKFRHHDFGAISGHDENLIRAGLGTGIGQWCQTSKQWDYNNPEEANISETVDGKRITPKIDLEENAPESKDGDENIPETAEDENSHTSDAGIQTEDNHSEQMGEQTCMKAGHFKPAPTIEEARLALEDLKKILKLQHTNPGYKDPQLDLLFGSQLEGMKQFLWMYINPQSTTHGKWQAASLKTANSLQRKPGHAQKLWE